MSATGDQNAAPRFWRSLGDLSDADLHDKIRAELPSLATRLPAGIDRRQMLRLMGASLGLAGLTACRKAEAILPYVEQPENLVQGRPLHYATALNSDGYGIGAVVRSDEGRPTKVEGNPDHPASLGATDAIMQAAAHDLFDPARAREPLREGMPESYARFLRDVSALREDMAQDGGRSVALLIEPSSSPTLARQIEALGTEFSELRVFSHAPLARNGMAAATRVAFGRALDPLYHIERAKVIVSLDDDFLGEGAGRLAHARTFADARRVRAPSDRMNRLYAVESTPSLTGAAADHRKTVRPSGVAVVAEALLAALRGDALPADLPVDAEWLSVVAADLRAAGSAALVLGGPQQDPRVAAAALRINHRLGAMGETVDYIAPVVAAQDSDLAALCDAIRASEVQSVLCLADDPVNSAFGQLDAADAFARLRRLWHLSLYYNKTSSLAGWHIPTTHSLEDWSDLRAHDGTAAIVQPLIAPLYGAHSAHEVLAALSGEFQAEPRALVRQTWRALSDQDWQRTLQRGTVGNSASAIQRVSEPREAQPVLDPPANGIDLRFVPDPWLRDGRHANSAWLQELPRPLTKLVWGNAALIAPALAERLGVSNSDLVEITAEGRALSAPIWIVAGHPDETITLSLGFGQTDAPVAAMSTGYDGFNLRPGNGAWYVSGASVKATGGRGRVITTQHHQAMEGSRAIRAASLAQFRETPGFVHDAPEPAHSLYPDWDYPEEAWGMSIDTSACIGCMSCVSACQSENSIPTVGPEECDRGHEMHWLRVDRYYEGPPDAPSTYFQPVPCMHCEKAPCEIVCPVNATVHTHDGLNAQVYNRCIGTRYCSQNCPYKVRRFNFLDYNDFKLPDAHAAARNPDVSVRERGVMEKCTYCVQRISAARIEADVDRRPIADGEIVTACQQACPTGAITFGDVNDPDAQVRREKSAPQDYALLAELNTRPRTTYLGDIGNPNPDIREGDEDG